MEKAFKKVTQTIKDWRCRDNGATAIEYSLIAVGIAVTIVAIVALLGGNVRDKLFTPVSTALDKP